MGEDGHSKKPRVTRDAEWYDANPHARMSFSRLATYERCPAWFRHQYLEWHRTWDLPVLRAGHLVQNALERVFDSEPAADVTLESLQERALGRFQTLLRKDWETETLAYGKNPNAYGSFDLPIDRYLDYGERGLEFHIQELRARIDCRHPRTGERLPLPSGLSIAEAWREIRPLHAKHGAALGETMEHVPEGYLQGEYDLVYTWTGGRRIVDLKASGGDSPFSKEVKRQLASYALLEARLGRGQPEGLEAWFLGKDAPVAFPHPHEEELTSLDDAVQDLIDRAGSERGFGDWNRGDFPAAPAQVPGFPAEGGNPSIWCSFCPAAFVCSRSEAEKVPPRDGIDLSEPLLGNRTQVRGLVLGVGEARDRSTGKQTRRFTLGNGNAAASFTWPSHVVERLIQSGLRAGRVVRLTGLRSWKHRDSGAVLWYDTPATELDVEEELFGGPRADPEALHPSI